MENLDVIYVSAKWGLEYDWIIKMSRLCKRQYESIMQIGDDYLYAKDNINNLNRIDKAITKIANLLRMSSLSKSISITSDQYRELAIDLLSISV